MTPICRVGIVGGGQLGRMLALAAAPLNVECIVLDPAEDACAGVAATHIRAAFDDVAALRQLANDADVVTFEFENVPAPALATVAECVRTAPSPTALEASQDRLVEKRLFERLGIATAPYHAVDSLAELTDAIEQIGLPAILKTRRLGYDGKGQARIDRVDDASAAWTAIDERPAILEGHVSFQRELSVIAVRDVNGEAAYYPPVENLHRDGILRETRAPAKDMPDELSRTARDYAESLMQALDYVGVIALELFQLDDHLLANEFAPRVHNSGHWTIDASPTSQFENHIRAVAGLPLGATQPVSDCVMLNLVGGAPEATAMLAVPGAHLHLYGKQERPGRKIGHVTITDVAAIASTGATRMTHDEATDRLRAAVETATR